MSYTNVYPSRINWENEPSIQSPINATNLNKMDYALYEHDRTLENWATTKANQSDLLLSVKSIDYDDETGVFVFTWQNGTTKTVDLNIEKIPVSFSMSPQGVITMTTDDGTTYTADVGSLIKTYTFADSSVIDFTVTTDQSGNKTVTANIVDGSITGDKLQPNYLADCQTAKQGAESAAGSASDSSEDAEAWAKGTRNGVPVPSTDPAYENNSKYWAEHTSNQLAGLSDVDISNVQDGDILAYNGTASKWKNGKPTAGGGSKIKVTTAESTLYGEDVTLTQGTTTLTATFDSYGVAIFEGVTLTGNVQLTSTDGQSTSTRTLNIPYFGNYEVTMAFFSATINVTYPSGAVCTITDGTTTLTATSNPMAFDIPNAGTWTATATLDGVSKQGTPISITTDGQTATDTIVFGTINLTISDEFRGLSITCVNGGTTITKTAPISGNTMVFYPPSTGEWVISGTYSGTVYQTSATVTSLSTPVSASLQTMITKTVTLHGANTDTITFTDASGVTKTEVFESGQTSKSVQIKIMPSGTSITFTSAVSKNPSNLSADYSKTVTVTSATTDIYVMPDNSIYWYGWESNSLVTTSGAVASYGDASCTKNTNSITMITHGVYNPPGGSSGVQTSVTGELDVTDLSTIKTILSSPTGDTSKYYRGYINSSTTPQDNNPIALATDDITSLSGDKYVGYAIGRNTNQGSTWIEGTITLSALWCE